MLTLRALPDTSPYFEFRLDTRPLAIPFTSYHYPRWTVFIMAAIVLWILLFALSKTLLVSFHLTSQQAEKGWEAKFSSWACLFVLAGWIWVSTLVVELHPAMRVARILGILLVIPLILFFEGIGFALLELRAKEIQRKTSFVRNPQSLEILNRFTQAIEPYLRAREWCLAVLIVLITTFVEFHEYWIPFGGYIGGAVARIGMTAVLATMAVIWVAQAPGKELGRTSPIGFLSIRGLPGVVDRMILALRGWAQTSCINYPSDIAVEMVRRIFQLPEEEPLPPGGALVFTELVRRYGYSDCDVTETYTIDHDGSCTFEQTEFVYIDPALLRYRRKFISPVAFEEKPKVSYKCYAVPRLGINIEQDIEAWKKLSSHANALEPWKFEENVTWNDDVAKTQAIIDITWDLITLSMNQQEALFFALSTKGTMAATTFNGPDNPGDDYWTRMLAKPCHRATTVIKLKENCGEGHITKRKLTAWQDDKAQEPETMLFENTQKTRVTEDGRCLTIDLLYGLPGLSYRADWQLKAGSQGNKLVGAALTHVDSPETTTTLKNTANPKPEATQIAKTPK